MAQLVLGGVLKHIRSDGHAPPTSFATRTPPVVYDDSIIIAATHPNVQRGNPVIDGWFLSDFYAFNYLLKGLGSEQTWLTAADPHKLLAKRENYLHGNPFQDRKIVLDRDLLERGELTPVTVVQSSEMIDRFLQEVRTGSKKAKSQAAPLLLLVFCHGGEHEFFLDNGNSEKGLTLTRLEEAIEPGCRVTLVSTAYESGGWVVSCPKNASFQPMDMTLLSASKKKSNSWQRSLSVGRYCGSVFASSLIDTLTSTASPLLEHVDDGAATNNDTAKKEPSELQPKNPNQQQTLTYNAFCQSILDTCRDKVHRLWREQEFTFSAQGDEWEHSWTGRSGIPLTHFEQRWNALAVYPYAGSLERKLDMDPSPTNPSFQYDGSTQTGGKELIDELAEAIHQNRVTDMARLFLQTCPGEENRGWYSSTNYVLENAAKGLPDEEEMGWIAADMIRFRWEMSLLCDHIVSCFGLRAPNGLICLLWDDRAWYYHNESTPRSQLAMYDGTRSHLFYRRFPHYGGNSCGPPFGRAVEYLAAALVETTQTFDECIEKADEILAFAKAWKGNFQKHIVQNENVVESGQKWFQTIGK